MLFQTRSVYDRNTSIGVKGLWECTLNRSNVSRWYSRFRDGRQLVEDDEIGGCPKLNRTGVNITAVADLVKNDHRIASRIIAESLNIPKSSESERGFGEERVVCTFCYTLLDT
jgi:hypothetical protein